MSQNSINTDHISDGSGDMFDRIAKKYDLLNQLMSFGLHHSWRRKLVRSLCLSSGNKVLDIATGTGDVAIAIAQMYSDVSVVGVDTSTEMIRIAREKIKKLGLENRIELIEQDAQNLSFNQNTFDAVSISFGIRNIPDRKKSLQEMIRVTKKDGHVSILEFMEPSDTFLGMFAKLHIHHIVPFLGFLLSEKQEYRYLQNSIENFPTPKKFKDDMQKVGFENIQIEQILFGSLCLFHSQL